MIYIQSSSGKWLYDLLHHCSSLFSQLLLLLLFRNIYYVHNFFVIIAIIVWYTIIILFIQCFVLIIHEWMNIVKFRNKWRKKQQQQYGLDWVQVSVCFIILCTFVCLCKMHVIIYLNVLYLCMFCMIYYLFIFIHTYHMNNFYPVCTHFVWMKYFLFNTFFLQSYMNILSLAKTLKCNVLFSVIEI